MGLNSVAQERIHPQPPDLYPTFPISTGNFTFRVGSRSEQGHRKKNEDRFFADAESRLFLVADGMGGQEDGDRASSMAAEIIPHVLRDRLPLAEEVKTAVQETLREANERIATAGMHRPQGRRMGTTVVLAFQYRRLIYVTGIGDSRVYLVRGNLVKQLTTDHTVADALERNGDLTPEQAGKSPWRHILYKFLGNPEMRDRADVRYFTPQPDDRLLLASDGLTNHVFPEDMLASAKEHSDIQEWVDHLVELALTRGSRDNVTGVGVALEAMSEND